MCENSPPQGVQKYIASHLALLGGAGFIRNGAHTENPRLLATPSTRTGQSKGGDFPMTPKTKSIICHFERNLRVQGKRRTVKYSRKQTSIYKTRENAGRLAIHCRHLYLVSISSCINT